MPITEQDGYLWLAPDYRPPSCSKCHGRDSQCAQCRGTGRSAPIYSRTDAIRRIQSAQGHAPCFGIYGKSKRPKANEVSPENCGEPECPFRKACIGLHSPSQFSADRIREESVEYLSRVFLNAKAIERRSSQLSPFQADIANLVHEWRDDTPQVAVLGAFSAGKSTLLNNLLEQKILPATRTPTTAVVTSIRYAPKAHAVLHYRPMVRISLLSQDARNADQSVIQALTYWIQNTETSQLRSILEIDERGEGTIIDPQKLFRELKLIRTSNDKKDSGKLSKLKRAIVPRIGLPIENVARTFEVHFESRPPRKVDLKTSSDITEFGRYLTEPELALSITRAVCFLPDKRLQFLNFLDTAGLCSPVSFHTDVTSELLKRRPDKILVLLDARRLDSPTNREALRVLGRFVAVPDDYRQVTFALTFWDLALRTHMTEDSEPELDFSSPSARAHADQDYSRTMRRELASLLSGSVGVPCSFEPMAFTLGLGIGAPPDLRRSVETLWRHLESDCRGWVGVEMWGDRWRPAKEYADRLASLHESTADDIKQSISHASDRSVADSDIARIEGHEKQIDIALKRSIDFLTDVISSQKRRMLSEVSSLDTKNNLLAYLDSGYWESANTSLNSLQTSSNEANKSLTDLYRGFRSLRTISLDRKLLGLDQTARNIAKSEVSGVAYGLKSIWDFLLGGIVELNAKNRAAAREILRGQVGGMIDILSRAVDEWKINALRVSNQAKSEFSDRRNSVNEKLMDSVGYAERLRKKESFLDRSKPQIVELTYRISRFVSQLDDAKTRIESSRQTEFVASIFIAGTKHRLRKGREEDLLILHSYPAGIWEWLELRIGEHSKRYFPALAQGGRTLIFADAKTLTGASRYPVGPPFNPGRFVLRLSTLEGNFLRTRPKRISHDIKVKTQQRKS